MPISAEQWRVSVGSINASRPIVGSFRTSSNKQSLPKTSRKSCDSELSQTELRFKNVTSKTNNTKCDILKSHLINETKTLSSDMKVLPLVNQSKSGKDCSYHLDIVINPFINDYAFIRKVMSWKCMTISAMMLLLAYLNVLPQLLLICGDVETNPGPIGQLTSSNLALVRRVIWNARSLWSDLGLELGIEYEHLKVIKQNNKGDTNECFTDMLNIWLSKNDPKPSWLDIVEALRSPTIEQKQMAEEIMKAYPEECQVISLKSPTTPQQSDQVPHYHYNDGQGAQRNFTPILGVHSMEQNIFIGLDARKNPRLEISSPATNSAVLQSNVVQQQPATVGDSVTPSQSSLNSEAEAAIPVCVDSQQPHSVSICQGESLAKMLYTEQQVKDNLQALEDRFTSLTIKITNYCREITSDLLLTAIRTLPGSRRNAHFQNFFCQIKDQNLKNNALWDHLCGYWNFLNYPVLDHLIKNLGPPELQAMMTDYIHDLKEVCKACRLCCVVEYFPEICPSEPNFSDHSKLHIKLDKSWDVRTLHDLDKSFQCITRRSSLKGLCEKILENISKGCIEVTWSIPKAIACTIKEDLLTADVSFFKEQGIESLTIDTEEIYVAKSLETVKQQYNESEDISALSEENDSIMHDDDVSSNYTDMLSSSIADAEQSEKLTEKSTDQSSDEDMEEKLKDLEKDFQILESRVLDKIDAEYIDVDNFSTVFKTSMSHLQLLKESTVCIGKLKTYWNFKNYELLKQLVRNCGDNSFVNDIQEYERKFTEFIEKAKFRLFDKWPDHSTLLGEKMVFKSVKVSKERIVYLAEVEQCRKLLFDKFGAVIFLKSIQDERMEWLVPKSVLTEMKREFEKEEYSMFEENGVDSIAIENETYIFSAVKKYRISLKEKYKSFSVQKGLHFDLAEIEKRKVTYDEAQECRSLRMYTRNDIDDVLYEKSPLKEEDIAKYGCSIILIEGAPGVGKTTFSKYFCQKWGMENVFHDYHIVVLLELRNNNVKSAKNLGDLFNHCLKQEIEKEVVDSEGKGVVLWLEGWDELKEDKRTTSSIFLDLLKRQLLPKATIIVTSRPWASEYIRENCMDDNYNSQHIEILSCSQQQINRILGEGLVDEKQFSHYIASNPSIKAAMYTPVTANLVVEVFKWNLEFNTKPPTTMTQLYTAFICKLLNQHLGEHSLLIKTIADLPSKFSEQFLSLCRLAYEGVNTQRLIFNVKELPKGILPNHTLGLMKSDSQDRMEDYGNTYSFIHLTLQEFLAAYHVHTTESISQQEKQDFIVRHLSSGYHKMMLRFLAGLSKFTCHDSSTLELFEDKEYPWRRRKCYKCKYYNISLFHWLFEAESCAVIAQTLGSHLEKISIDSKYSWTLSTTMLLAIA